MKHIDADKLIAEIERLIDLKESRVANKRLNELLSFTTSLQQEQPKFKVGDTIHKIGENTVFPMTIERICDGDYVCVTEHQQSFINIKFQDDYELVEQEQPEVDLEKEAVSFCFDNGINISPRQAKNIANHFYELGLNARKQ